MGALPPRYSDLNRDGVPRLVKVGLTTYGVKEYPGGADNPTIMAWADSIGLERTYTDDAIPWCGLWMAYVCHQAQRDVVENPLWARNWARWGVRSERASLGDILVFSRNGGGHVGLYVGEDEKAYHVLGGNQSDSVNITRILKSRCIAVRSPVYRLRPALAVPVQRLATGGLSANEA